MAVPGDFNAPMLLYLNPELVAYSNVKTVEEAHRDYTTAYAGLRYKVPPLPLGFDAKVYLAAQDDVSGINETIRVAMLSEGISLPALERRGVYVGTLMEPVVPVGGGTFSLPPGSAVTFTDSNLRLNDEVKLLRGSKGDPLHGRVVALTARTFTLSNPVYGFPGPASTASWTAFGIKVFDPERQARVAWTRNAPSIAQGPATTDDSLPRKDFSQEMYHAVYPDTRGFGFADTYIDYRTKWRRNQEYRIIQGRDIFNLSAPYTSNLLYSAQQAANFNVSGDFTAGGGSLQVTPSNAYFGATAFAGPAVYLGVASQSNYAAPGGSFVSVTPSNLTVAGGVISASPSRVSLCSNLTVTETDCALLSGMTLASCNVLIKPDLFAVSPSFVQSVMSGANLIVTPSNILAGFSNVQVTADMVTVESPLEVQGGVGLGLPQPDPAASGTRLAVLGDIFTTGTLVTQSDARAKTDVEPLQDALEKLQRLGGYTYAYKSAQPTPHQQQSDACHRRRRHVGLLAQEVAQVLPEAVYVGAGDNPGYQSIAYGNLAGLFVEAIKTLSHRLDRIELLLLK